MNNLEGDRYARVQVRDSNGTKEAQEGRLVSLLLGVSKLSTDAGACYQTAH